MAEFVPFDGQLDSEQAGTNLAQFTGKLDEVQPAKPLDYRKELGRQLGLTARAGITGVTTVPVAAADFLGGATNLIAGKQVFPPQYEAFQKFLTQLGLPEPKGGLEQGVQMGAGALAGAFDPFISGAQKALDTLSPKGFVSPRPASQGTTAKELHDAGYVLPPTEMGGGPVSRSLEGVGGSRRVAELAQARNQAITQDLATKALKLPKGTPITQEILEQQADELIKLGYDPIRNIPRVTVGSKYRGDLRSIVDDLGGSDSFPLASRNEVKALVNRYRYNDQGRPIQAYTGEDALKEIKLLRQAAKADFKPGGDPLLGEARRRIATALEDNIELVLTRTGNMPLVKTFREARTGLAKNFAVERMLADPDSGIVSTVKAAQQLRAGVPLTGELHTIAKAGSPLFARATGVPVHGVPPAVNYGDALFYGGAMGSAPFTGGLGALFGAVPATRAGARSAVLSKPMQKLLASGMAPTQPFPVAGRIGIASPEQFSPLFSQGEQ